MNSVLPPPTSKISRRCSGQFRIGNNSSKNPIGFLFTTDHFNGETRNSPDRFEQFGLVFRVPRCAGGDDPRRERPELRCNRYESADALCGALDGLRAQSMSSIEALSQSGLLTLFEERRGRRPVISATNNLTELVPRRSQPDASSQERRIDDWVGECIAIPAYSTVFFVSFIRLHFGEDGRPNNTCVIAQF